MTVRPGTIYLTRHAQHAMAPDLLLGRQLDPGLSGSGQELAEALAREDWVKDCCLVCSSPRRRAIETAEFIAEACGRTVLIDAAFDEVDFGVWSGHTFADLDSEPSWKEWNANRATAATQAGETMGSIARRCRSRLEQLKGENPGSPMVVVSHAEVIRAVLLEASGLSFDDWRRIEIAFGSVHNIELREGRISTVGRMEGATG